jgi:hypothetical protein
MTQTRKRWDFPVAVLCSALLSGTARLRSGAKMKNGWRSHHPLKLRASDVLLNYGASHAIAQKKSKLDLSTDNFRQTAGFVNLMAVCKDRCRVRKGPGRRHLTKIRLVVAPESEADLRHGSWRAGNACTHHAAGALLA